MQEESIKRRIESFQQEGVNKKGMNRRSESNLSNLINNNDHNPRMDRLGLHVAPAWGETFVTTLSSRTVKSSSFSFDDGNRKAESPFVHCQSSNSLGREALNKCMSRRLRSAQSLSAFRSSRSSRDFLKSLHSATSHHQGHPQRLSGGPNAEFGLFSDKLSPSKPESTMCLSKSSTAPPPTVKLYARINIRYKNDCGRAVALATSNAVHHDIKVNRILNATISCDGLAGLERSENIEWIDRMGAVYFDM